MRVNELAKEVGKTPREVMDLLEKHNIKKSAHPIPAPFQTRGMAGRRLERLIRRMGWQDGGSGDE